MSKRGKTQELAVRRPLSLGIRRRLLLTTLRASASLATQDECPKKTRKRISRLSRLAPPVPGVLSRYGKLGDVHVRWFQPRGTEQTKNTIFYVHGGGFAACDLRSHRILASSVAKAAGARCVLIAYRRAPNHPFPTPLDDCCAAYDALIRRGVDPRQVVVVGDSAGGNLALGLMQRLRDRGERSPAGVALMSPWVDLTMTGDSIKDNRTRDYLHPGLLKVFVDSYLQGHDAADPLVSPRFANFEGFPPMLIQIGTHEVLLSEVREMTRHAREQGAHVELQEWAHMFHAFPGFSFALSEAAHALSEVGGFIRSKLPHEATSEDVPVLPKLVAL